MRMECVGEYSATVIDHYRNPRNVGEIEGSPAVAQVGDPGGTEDVAAARACRFRAGDG